MQGYRGTGYTACEQCHVRPVPCRSLSRSTIQQNNDCLFSIRDKNILGESGRFGSFLSATGNSWQRGTDVSERKHHLNMKVRREWLSIVYRL